MPSTAPCSDKKGHLIKWTKFDKEKFSSRLNNAAHGTAFINRAEIALRASLNNQTTNSN
jgi:hypothetical protein